VLVQNNIAVAVAVVPSIILREFQFMIGIVVVIITDSGGYPMRCLGNISTVSVLRPFLTARDGDGCRGLIQL
jgi:hypothetical protein